MINGLFYFTWIKKKLKKVDTMQIYKEYSIEVYLPFAKFFLEADFPVINSLSD